MTDSAAKPSAAPARARKTFARLAQYLLLQAVIVALCVLVLQHRLPEPPVRTLTGWRQELVGADLRDLLSGRSAIAVGQERRLVLRSLNERPHS